MGWIKDGWKEFRDDCFTSPFKQNILICLATYLILIVYSFVCIGFIQAADTSEAAAQTDTVTKLQFFFDSLFPSTITLLITIIVQNIIECARKKDTKYSLTILTIIYAILYIISGLGMRMSLTVGWFAFFAVMTLGLVAVGVLSVKQVELSGT